MRSPSQIELNCIFFFQEKKRNEYDHQEEETYSCYKLMDSWRWNISLFIILADFHGARAGTFNGWSHCVVLISISYTNWKLYLHDWLLIDALQYNLWCHVSFADIKSNNFLCLILIESTPLLSVSCSVRWKTLAAKTLAFLKTRSAHGHGLWNKTKQTHKKNR